jgi:hypothetical protein
MPQADVITNGAMIISGFPIFIFIHWMFADTYDDSAIEDRLYDLMETTTDTDRSVNMHESYMQELIATIPAYINELFLTNFLILKNWINSYVYIFNYFETSSQLNMRSMLNTYIFDMYILNDILFEFEDSMYAVSFSSLFDTGNPFLNALEDEVTDLDTIDTTPGILPCEMPLDADLSSDDILDSLEQNHLQITGEAKKIIYDALRPDFERVDFSAGLPTMWFFMEKSYMDSSDVHIDDNFLVFDGSDDELLYDEENIFYYADFADADVFSDDLERIVSEFELSLLDDPELEDYSDPSVLNETVDPDVLSFLNADNIPFYTEMLSTEVDNLSASIVLQTDEALVLNSDHDFILSDSTLVTSNDDETMSINLQDYAKVNRSVESTVLIFNYLESLDIEMDESFFISDHYLLSLTSLNNLSPTDWLDTASLHGAMDFLFEDELQ